MAPPHSTPGPVRRASRPHGRRVHPAWAFCGNGRSVETPKIAVYAQRVRGGGVGGDRRPWRCDRRLPTIANVGDGGSAGRSVAVVLFTDLVGSTELRSRLGEEPAEELRRRHDRVLTEAVEAHAGRVVKGLGDGIMATFVGAADAVAAAVAIQQAVDRLNRSGKTPSPLAVRVGLSAGDVTFDDHDVHGTPVIEASRLCAAAQGGEVLASELVSGLVGASSEVSFTAVGALDLKGLPRAVPAVRVDWEPAAVSTIPMPALLTDVGRIFVGRDAELERLTQLWKEATAGERRVALLAGEPGVGKTRLAAKLAGEVYEQGGVVLAGRCDEDLGVPYQPFVEALRHFVDEASTEELAGGLGRYGGELVRLVPELAGQMPELPPPLKSDPETERYRLFDAVAAWLAAAAAYEPVLLVLDDLQWAAKPTLLLLRHVVRAPEATRLLVLGTYRDTELTHDHPLVEVVADFRRDAGVERISLSGLDDLGVAAIVEQAAGQALDEGGVTLARAIYEETEGNPFFVREVLRHLAETGAIERRGDGWATRVAVGELGIPEGVRDVVGRRLARLSANTNRAPRVAAVVGAEFDLGVVQAAGGLGDETLLGALEEAAGARLVTEASATRYRFGHALVRATLYESLTAPRKIALHRKVAEAIEVVHEGAPDDHLPALAHHWARASAPAADTARAVDYAIRAGDRALTQLAHDEALAYNHQALELLVSQDDPRRLELLISLGDAERRAGDPVHRQTLLEVARVAQRHGDVDALTRAALANNRGIYSVSGFVDQERVSVLEAALDGIGPSDTATRARLLAVLAAELGFAPDHANRERLSTDALAIARRLDDMATLGDVLARRWAVMAPTAPVERQEELEELEELAQVAGRLGDPVLAFWAAMWSSMNAGVLADGEAFQTYLARAAELAGTLGQPFYSWLVGFTQATAACMAGRLAEAEAKAVETLELARAGGIPDGFQIYGAGLPWIRYEQGRLEEVAELLRRAVARRHNPLTPVALAFTLCALDHVDEARPVFDRLAEDDFATLPGNFLWLYGMCIAAEACARLGDRERAAVLHDRLSPHGGLVASAWAAAAGAVDHYLGLLATTLGRHDVADGHFAVAERVHAGIPAPPWMARTRLEWARMLLTRRHPGDAQRARELLSEALATARELGLGGVEGRAVALLQDCP